MRREGKRGERRGGGRDTEIQRYREKEKKKKKRMKKKEERRMMEGDSGWRDVDGQKSNGNVTVSCGT